MKNKRILIKCIKPTICKHQMSDIIEYHDGNYDIDVWCGLSKERTKCKQSNCEKKEFGGISYDEAIEKMAKAIYRGLKRDVEKNNDYNAYIYAKTALNALLK